MEKSSHTAGSSSQSRTGAPEPRKEDVGASRSVIKGKLAATFAFVMTAQSAVSANYFNYAQWDRMSLNDRAAYIAGSFDTLITVGAAGTAKAMDHYEACMNRAGLTNVQLAENVRLFAASRPAMHGGPLQVALVSYLVELCGKAPLAN